MANLTHALTYSMDRKKKLPYDFTLIDIENKIVYIGKGGMLNKTFKSHRLHLEEQQLDYYLETNYRNVVPLTIEQFKKFLNFPVTAFESKSISKTFPRFGLAEWLI